MTNQKETAAFGSSVGADERQTIHKCTDNSISVCNENIKGFEEMQKELLQGLLQGLDLSYLKTISMSELYDTVYQSKPPLIDGLLYPGVYIFAGSPKHGKIFLMAQIA